MRSAVIRQLMVAVVMCMACVGCSAPADKRKEAIRRNLLRGDNLAEKRAQVLAAQRTADTNGELLPSDNVIAGVALPRGFEPKFTLDYEWHYDGEQSIERVETYFRRHLDATVEQVDRSSIVFSQAKSKGDPSMAPVKLTIFPVPGRSDWSRIQIVAPRPTAARTQSAAEIEAELANRRKNMH